MKKIQFSKEFLNNWGQIIFGCILGAMAYPLFLVPNQIAPGGVTGLSTVLNVAFGWPVGIVSYAMNVPLFISAIAMIGKRFFFKSLLATTIFSLLIDFFSMFMPALTHNPMLATLYGGAFLGLGLGFILRGGATTGGTDLSARLLNGKIHFISIAAFIFLQDLVVVVIAGIVIDVQAALFAIINIAVVSVLIDLTLQGFNRSKACYIFSPKTVEISQRLMKDIGRGTTLFSAKGGYTQKENPVLLCVFNPRELYLIKQIVNELDPKAFMFITSVTEALGEGFKELNGKQ